MVVRRIGTEAIAAAGARPGSDTGRRAALSPAVPDLAGMGGWIESGGSVRPAPAKLPRNFPLVAWDGTSSRDSVESQFLARSATVPGRKGRHETDPSHLPDRRWGDAV